MRRQTVCRELPSQARTVDRDTRTVIDERRTVDSSCVGAAQHDRDPFRFQQTAELRRGTGSTQHPHDGLTRTVERRTRELKALSEQVIALSRALSELWSRG